MDISTDIRVNLNIDKRSSFEYRTSRLVKFLIFITGVMLKKQLLLARVVFSCYFFVTASLISHNMVSAVAANMLITIAWYRLEPPLKHNAPAISPNIIANTELYIIICLNCTQKWAWVYLTINYRVLSRRTLYAILIPKNGVKSFSLETKHAVWVHKKSF